MKDEPMNVRSQMLILFCALALVTQPAAADPPTKKAVTKKAGSKKAVAKKAVAKKAGSKKAVAKKAGSKKKTGAVKGKGGPGAPVPGSQPSKNPFRRLKVVVPKDKLGPIKSVRVRTKQEAKDRSRTGTVKVSVSSKPKGAAVYYGGKLLGTTPFSISATRGSTPLDVVVRKPGYMVLRTRVRRKVSRQYIFRLTPAKIR